MVVLFHDSDPCLVIEQIPPSIVARGLCLLPAQFSVPFSEGFHLTTPCQRLSS